MNKQALQHIPDSQYCFALDRNRVVIRLRAEKRTQALDVEVLYYYKYEFGKTQKIASMRRILTDRLFDWYEAELCLDDRRLAYIFHIRQDGQECFYSEDGLTDDYDFHLTNFTFFQLPYINDIDVHRPAEWLRDAVFYQIFVDRFRAGNGTDASRVTMDWGGKPTHDSIAGGNLRGIIEKLPHIRSLGVNALYLTPIFLSASNHKYNTIDYYTIDPGFGTKDDLRELIDTAHGLGIRIVLDAVFNHCGAKSAIFLDVIKNGRASRYYDWFIIDGDFPTVSPLNYQCFAHYSDMPKLNASNPEVREYLTDVALYWIKEFDIDGWRLDVSDEVAHVFWRELRLRIMALKPDCVLIGENWHSARPWLRGDEFDSIMNYAFTKASLDFFALGRYDARAMAERLSELLMRSTRQVNLSMLNLLDSHDTERFLTWLKGDRDKLLCALALLIFYPGAPCMFYGTEICIEGGSDPDCRRCFDWDERRWDMRFLERLRELTALRARYRSLREGGCELCEEQGMLSITRVLGDERVRLYINLTNEAKTPDAVGKPITSNMSEMSDVRPNGYLVILLDCE